MSGLILRDVRVATELTDVAITDGLITAVGAGLAACGAEELRLDGRVLVPGLWDNHTHMSQWSLMQQRTHLGSAASAREAVAIVGDALMVAGRAPLDTEGLPLPFVGNGFRDGVWPDVPTLELLDGLGDRPIVLVSHDLHCVWLNTPALERYGHAGNPTGLLLEDAAFAIEDLINTVPDEVLDGWVIDATRAAAARGVVGVVDLEMRWNLDDWVRRRAAGMDSLRVDFGMYSQHLERGIELGLRTGQQIDDLVTVGMLKVLTDGSLGSRTAFCRDPYPGLEGTEGEYGLLTVSPERLRPLLRRGWDSGIVSTVHAIGDHALSLALDAFAQLAISGRIEHAQLLADDDIARFGELGLVASVQPEHAMDDRDIADRYWGGRTHRAFTLRSLVDAGIELALGSDAPVAPLDPWVTIAAAVTRARDGRVPWHPEQSLSVAEALQASTRSVIAVGQPADLVVLEADPQDVEADALRSLPVAATLLGGRFTHSTL